MTLPAFPIVPTTRAAWLLAAIAPLAVVIAAARPELWVLAPAAGVALLAVVLLDGAVAGRLLDWQLHAPGDAEVGEPLAIGFTATFRGRTGGGAPQGAVQFDARLEAQGDGQEMGAGRAIFDLSDRPGRNMREGSALLIPRRRGPAPLIAMWLRWDGPLGLGARQKRKGIDHTVRVWPDLSPIRSRELQAFLRDAQFGLIARRIRGEGTQFEALSEYEPGMDRRRIDWKASARHTRLYARENESERNNQIVFAFDCGQSMCEPVDGLPRLDRAVTAALTASYVALKGGDRVSLFGFARRPELATPFYGDARAFHRLQSAAASLDYMAQEPNFTLALATLTGRLQRRSLIVLFSDFSDPTGAELMIESVARLVERHVVLFVTIADSELSDLGNAAPRSIPAIARAVTADTLLRQRAVVLERLRQLGVDIIEAPHDQIGYRLIDRYLEIKRAGSIG